MAGIALDRHEVLETIRQSNSLREAFLGVAKLQGIDVQEIAKETWIRASTSVTKPNRLANADRIRSSSNEDIAVFVLEILDLIWRGATDKPMTESRRNEYRKMLLDWLKSPVGVDNADPD